MTHRLQCRQNGRNYEQICPFCNEPNVFRFDDMGVAEYLEKCEHVQSLHTVEQTGKAIQFRSED